MSSVMVSVSHDLSLPNSDQSSLRLREMTLADRVKALREITLSLLTDLESLGSPAVADPERNLRLDD